MLAPRGFMALIFQNKTYKLIYQVTMPYCPHETP